MSSKKLKGRYLKKIGFPKGEIIGFTMELIDKHYKYENLQLKLDMLQAIIDDPEKYRKDEILGQIVEKLKPVHPKSMSEQRKLRDTKIDYKTYGVNEIEPSAIEQMETAMKLPVSVAGALMPDAHQGYGLPIGGVLATDNVVIPYAVGMDIGCRMCMSVYALPENYIERYSTNLKKHLIENTRFGQKEMFDNPAKDPVLERKEFREIDILQKLHGKAIKQIGTSGSGNHFVEFGELEINDVDNEFELPPGKYVAVLSHSGSRWLGHEIARYYTKIAIEKCRLPKGAKHLAWLEIDSHEGNEYWLAMNLAGDYSSANHRDIHKRISKAIREKPVAIIENHHNFAWKEKLADGRQVIIHRKGATPAGIGALGIIPGSMATPAFLVRGKGEPLSLNSASHGAGRRMSRAKAKSNISPKELKQLLKKANVELIGGGTDESPMAYKDIYKVMEYQKDLVEIIGIFSPRIVRMDG